MFSGMVFQLVFRYLYHIYICLLYFKVFFIALAAQFKGFYRGKTNQIMLHVPLNL